MFKEGDFVVYRNRVCKIKNIKKNHLSGRDYYVMFPVDDESLIIDVPIDGSSEYLKEIITKKEALELIEKMPSIDVIDFDEKYIENEYKRLMSTGNREDLIKIIKTPYLINKSRKDLGRKTREKDSIYFEKAEKFLYNELALSLGMDFDETKKFIIEKLSENS